MLWIFFFLDVLLVIAHIFLRQSLGFFDLDKEGNLASLYAGVKLWIGATAAFFYAWYLKHSSARRILIWVWRALAAMLAYLGVDDMMVIHERIGFVLNNRLRLNGYYGESFNWLIYFSPLALAGAGVLYVAAKNLWRTHRATALLIGIGAAIMVLSLVVESYSGYLLIHPPFNVSFYYFLIIVEELFEMVGTSCVVGGIISVLRRIEKEQITVR